MRSHISKARANLNEEAPEEDNETEHDYRFNNVFIP